MLIEVYKTTRGQNPIFMSKIFTQKKQYCNLWIINQNFPKPISLKYGTNTFGFHASHLWNHASDSK